MIRQTEIQDLTNEALVQLIQENRDPSDYQRLIGVLLKRLTGLADYFVSLMICRRQMWFVSPEDREELIQDALLAAHEAIMTYNRRDNEISFKTYAGIFMKRELKFSLTERKRQWQREKKKRSFNHLRRKKRETTTVNHQDGRKYFWPRPVPEDAVNNCPDPDPNPREAAIQAENQNYQRYHHILIPPPDRQISTSEGVAQLTESLSQIMTTRESEAIRLRYQLDQGVIPNIKTAPAVAKQMGIRPATARELLRRGLKKIRRDPINFPPLIELLAAMIN